MNQNEFRLNPTPDTSDNYHVTWEMKQADGSSTSDGLRHQRLIHLG
jgi:hypothetical protein